MLYVGKRTFKSQHYNALMVTAIFLQFFYSFKPEYHQHNQLAGALHDFRIW